LSLDKARRLTAATVTTPICAVYQQTEGFALAKSREPRLFGNYSKRQQCFFALAKRASKPAHAGRDSSALNDRISLKNTIKLNARNLPGIFY